MKKEKILVRNRSGLHVRPAGVLAQISGKFESKVSLFFQGKECNAKSVLMVLGSGIKAGDEVEVVCEGKDEQEAMKAIVEAFETGLGEGVE